MLYDTSAYNIAKIRQLLLKAFTPEDLHRFCLDRPLFRPIVAKFGPGMGLDGMVDCVIDYCRVQFLWDELLTEVKQANPRQYARFAPDLLFAGRVQPSAGGHPGIDQGSPGQRGALSTPQAAFRPTRSGRPPVKKRRPQAPIAARPWHGRWDWTLWSWWLLATAVGWTVGLVGGGTLGKALDDVVHPEDWWSFLGAILVGSLTLGLALSGTAQWFLLRDRIQQAGHWLLVSAVVVVVGVIGILVPSAYTVVLFAAAIVEIAARWWILQRQVRWAGLWPLASFVALGLLLALSSLLMEDINSLLVVIPGILYGAITGVAMVWALSSNTGL